jgi:ATP-dependent Zn protease
MSNSISIEQVAYHEAGHALYYMMRGAVPDSIEVVDAGQGMTITDPTVDYHWS